MDHVPGSAIQSADLEWPIIKEMKRRRHFEKPSERKRRKAQEAERRRRKKARKDMVRT